MGERIMALEVAGERVRAAMADRTWNSLELLGAWEQERGADELDLAPAIARVLDAAGPPDVVISALPGEFVAKRLLTLPFNDRRRLAQVVPFALEEHLPFPVDDAAVAFARVGREDGKTLVIAAFARKEDLKNHLDLLARAGLDPKMVTLGTLALAGLLARARNGAGGSHLVVDIDHACTSMVLIDAHGTPRAVRTVGRGAHPNNGNVALPTPIAAVILGAVRQTLLAHESDEAPPDLVLTGAAGTTSAVRDQISSALSVPIHFVDEFDYTSFFAGNRTEPISFAPCLAMLLAEAPSRPLELLNFRQGEFAYAKRTGLLGPFRLTAILAGVAIFFALLHFILGIATSARQLHLLNQQIAEVSAPALGDKDPSEAQAALKQKITEMRKRLHLMGGNLGNGSPLDVLLALSRAIPPGVPVQINDLLIDDSGLKIQGTADSFATVDQVKKALERTRDFEQIQVEHATAGSDPGKVDFRLNVTLRENPMDAE
ncbi:MAG: PilN domain-containing protein [Deltaproteobacteria bacterium]|nr:PilN domain-containing protein [Deltaproteobacteria bacterium]